MKKLLLFLLVFFNAIIALPQEANDNPILNDIGISYDSIITYLSRDDITLDDKVMMARTGVEVLTPYDKTTRIFSMVLEQAKREENPSLIVSFYCMIANNYMLDSRLDQTKVYLDSAQVHISDTDNDESLGIYYYLLGLYHTFTGNQDAGHEAYYKSINHYEKAGNKLKLILFLLYDIAVPYVQQYDYIGLEPIVRKMLATAQQLNTAEGYILAYQLMGHYHETIFSKTHDAVHNDSTLYYHHLAIETYENASDLVKAIAINQIFDSYNVLLNAELENETPQWDTVLYYADKGLIHATPTDTVKVARIHISKSRAHMKRNNIKEADKDAKIALSLLQTQTEGINAAYYSALYEVMASISAAQGNYRASYQYEQLRNKAQKTVYDTERYEKIKELETKYQSEKKELEIAHLKAENSYQLRLRLWQWGIIVLLLGLSVFIYQWQRAKRKLVANRLHITRLEKEEVQLNLSLKEEQAARAEMEKYEALLEVHFKELNIEGKESELLALRAEKDELDKQIKAYSDKLFDYENSVALSSAVPTDENWTVIVDEMTQLISKRFKDDARETYLLHLKKIDKNFLKRMEEVLPNILSSPYLKYSICFVLDMPVKDVALCLSVEPNTVYTTRLRMKKKLKLKSGDNLDLELKKLS